MRSGWMKGRDKSVGLLVSSRSRPTSAIFTWRDIIALSPSPPCNPRPALVPDLERFYVARPDCSSP